MTAATLDLPSAAGFLGNADAVSRPWLPPIFREAVKFEPSSAQEPSAAVPSATNLLPLSHQSSYLGYAGSNKLPAASSSSSAPPHRRANKQFPAVLPSLLPSTALKSMGTIIAAQQAVPGLLLPEASSSSITQRIESPEDWIELMYDTSYYNRKRLPDTDNSPDDPKDTPCTVLLQMPPLTTRNLVPSGVPTMMNNAKRQLSPISQNAGAPTKPGRRGRRRTSRTSEQPGPRGSGPQQRQQPKCLSAKSPTSRSALSTNNSGGSDPKAVSSSGFPETGATAAKATYRKKRVQSSSNVGSDRALGAVPHLPPLKNAGSRT